MADFDILDGGKRLAKAAVEGDGLTASRVLEEAGSCRWPQVINQANSEFKALGVDSAYKLTSSSKISYKSYDETIELFRLGINVGNNRVLPLASHTDLRCDKQ